MPTDPVFDAFLAAQQRGAFGTALDTAGIRALAAGVRYQSVWSARCTSLVFAQEIKDTIDDLTNDKIGTSQAIARLAVKLRALGYTPEQGFPGEAAAEPVQPGTLQDLSSYRRLKLIVETQQDLMSGRGEQTRGHTPVMLQAFPAWELVRQLPVAVPRDWPSRWTSAGGKFYGVSGKRMIALKGDPVWGELGASGNFSDALDVDHPPFAFNSGMGWSEISREACQTMGVTGPDGESIADWQASQPLTLAGPTPLPAPRVSIRDLDPDLVADFQEATGAVPAADAPDTLTVPMTADGEIDFSDLMEQAIAARDASRKAGAP